MKKNTITNTIKRYCPKFDLGLSSTQVKEREKEKLINTENKTTSKTYLSIFVNNFCTFFNLLGLICFIALYLTGAKANQYVFVFFYIANILIGIIQEIRAKKSVDRLTLITDKGTMVMRDGSPVNIPVNEIVLDDVIILNAGSQIPADCIILEGKIKVNEALLTGESFPVSKTVDDTILAGSFVISGTCYARADKVGEDKFVSILSSKARKYKKPNSEIMNSLTKLIKLIGYIIVPIALATVIKSLSLEPDKIEEAILSSSTVTIGMIPAGMFLLTSVALAVGIINLAKQKVLVQDMYSLEMLARVDTVCFDKTGTITDGNMSVNEIVLLDKSVDLTEVIPSMMRAFTDKNQTSDCLINHFGIDGKLNAKQVINFDSIKKLSAVTFENGETYALGAPEFILDEESYKKISRKVDNFAKQGQRVILFAKSSTEIINDIVPHDFLAVSLITLADNIRPEAFETIKWFKENNVQIKIISGDNPLTVSEVSKRAGVTNADKYVSLEDRSDEEVYNLANKYTVFGRVSPNQKAILIKALKDAGHVTAMTGDGVNDILALRESDCAISVSKGSEAAKKVSHLILTDDNFNSLPKVVYEGRRVINNVQQSASLFLMKTIFTMFVATISLLIPYMTTYPFVASQMYPLEFLIIGMPAFFLS
jgi:cation-transporting ATPase E